MIASGLATTTFTDTGRTNGTPYFYRVTGTNSSGTGLPSGVVNDPGAIQPVVHLRFDEPTAARPPIRPATAGTARSSEPPLFPGKLLVNAVNLPGATRGPRTLPANVVGALNDFTISAWVKPNTIGTWSRVFDFGTGTNNYPSSRHAQHHGFARFCIRSPTVEEIINGTAALACWSVDPHRRDDLRRHRHAIREWRRHRHEHRDDFETSEPRQHHAELYRRFAIALDQVSTDSWTTSACIIRRSPPRSRRFRPAELRKLAGCILHPAQSAIATPAADANNDGYKNLLAYAFAASPWSNLAGSLPVAREAAATSPPHSVAAFPSPMSYGVEVVKTSRNGLCDQRNEHHADRRETEQVTIRRQHPDHRPEQTLHPRSCDEVTKEIRYSSWATRGLARRSPVGTGSPSPHRCFIRLDEPPPRGRTLAELCFSRSDFRVPGKTSAASASRGQATGRRCSASAVRASSSGSSLPHAR